MAFGARNDEGWRLCHRKGRTIYYINEKLYPHMPIEFRSQAKAKACADELNERWKEYDSKESKKLEPTSKIFYDFIEIIYKHDGIERQDYEEIQRNASQYVR